jgi:hypothetical protein
MKPGRKRVLTPKQHMDRLFNQKKAREGGVIVRRADHLLRYITLEELEEEVRRRGFHLFVTTSHVVISCNRSKILFCA